MRRAKIVATLGPATSTYEMVRAIIDAGVDVARFNLSHGDYSVHDSNFANVRKAADDAGRPVAILVDLQGPKIRLGKFENGPHELAEGDVFKITVDDILALSFVRNAKDVQRVHVIMAEEGGRVPVIAKIEKPQAVDNLEEIID